MERKVRWRGPWAGRYVQLLKTSDGGIKLAGLSDTSMHNKAAESMKMGNLT